MLNNQINKGKFFHVSIGNSNHKYIEYKPPIIMLNIVALIASFFFPGHIPLII